MNARCLSACGLLFFAACSTTSGLRVESSPSIEDDGESLAKKTQNPVSDLISLPFQNNYQGDFGKDNDGRNVLNIQPVYPADMGGWLLLNRPILPVIYQPAPVDGTDDELGLGDLTYTAWYSPKRDPAKPLVGLGGVVQLPTATDDLLGKDAVGLGPSVVVVKLSGKWVFGGLAQNVWGVAGSGRDDLNVFLVQPFINYNLSDGWYLTSAPIVTADWEADSDDRWIVPLGGGFGKVFTLGKQPMNCNTQLYWYAENPDIGPEWEFRIQVAFLFPK